MTQLMFHLLYAMKHGMYCWAEFHTVGHWTEFLCHKIEEDMPQWNCHTMGNHICGKVR